MKPEFHTGNRYKMMNALPDGALVVLFSGYAPRKRADEDYPFFADRNFVYLTGITRDAGLIYMAKKTGASFEEILFLLPPDMLKERWTGRRTKSDEAAALSGIETIAYTDDFLPKFSAWAHDCSAVYLDIDGSREERDFTEANRFAAKVLAHGQNVANVRPILAGLRTIKEPCEIAAMREAVRITGDGIRAMMLGVRDGMKEYEIKQLYDAALVKNGCLEPGFPSIISAGENNFCIHYYSYTGTAHDGDMVLVDVGACYDNVGCDISRGFPVNGKFTGRQRALYECAYETSAHLFDIIKPGYPMAEVDGEVRRYCAQKLCGIGVLKNADEAGRVMWHGGAHHVGYDTHDIVVRPETVAPGMVFCVDVGIYNEDWGIGFRLEDNCLVTETGCENLGIRVPRSIDEIEDLMKK